jgi:hypothetical protein
VILPENASDIGSPVDQLGVRPTVLRIRSGLFGGELRGVLHIRVCACRYLPSGGAPVHAVDRVDPVEQAVSHVDPHTVRLGERIAIRRPAPTINSRCVLGTRGRSL